MVPTGRGAILRMARALDRYVIRGVNHNIPFLRSVMDHPRFIAGDLSTKFIADEFHEGFKGHKLKPNQEEELVAIAAVIYHEQRDRAKTIDGQLHADEEPEVPSDPVIVTVEEKDHEVIVEEQEPEEDEDDDRSIADLQISFRVSWPESEKSLIVKHDWHSDSIIFNGHIGKKKVVVQVGTPTPLGLKLLHYGTQYHVLVRTSLQKQLSEHVAKKKADDVSTALRSPMPGLVLSVAVKPGDHVLAGQELAVVEAMKMQNILRAEKNGVVSAVLATPGTSVAVDDVLVEFKTS